MILNNKETKEFAINLGFDLIGIIPAEPLKFDGAHLKKWLAQGFEGDMDYMEKNPEARSNPQEILPGAKSVICLGLNYFQTADNASSNFKVARYAFGKDYHKVIEKKLKKLRSFLIEKTGGNKTDFKLYSDAGPMLERGFAVKAGLGFVGKNSTLITPEFGSWVFLAELITTFEFEYDKPTQKFQGACGSCNRCIKACPTNAIVKPYTIDARKCISYQTIENKGPLAVNLKGRVFGCDICQEVCPHNCRAKKTQIPEFLSHITGSTLNPDAINKMTEEEFNLRFAGSPIRRTGLNGIKRNIQNML